MYKINYEIIYGLLCSRRYIKLNRKIKGPGCGKGT